MSNLIQYIIQDDPEDEEKRHYQEEKDEWDRDNESSADKAKKSYNFSSNNLLENRESLINKSSSNSLSASENKPQTSNRQPTSNLASNPGETNTSFLPKYQKLIDQHYDDAYKSEGNPNYVYLDPKYIKTIGRGENINTFETFDKINFRSKKSGNIATKQEKIDNFNKLENWTKANKKNATDTHNYKASYFRDLSDLYIDSKEEKRLHTEHVLKDIPVIKNIIKNYDELNHEKQLAILDMVYNLGATKFDNQFKKFINAVNSNSVDGMLAEYHRKGISEERNRWTADLLKK